MARTIGGRGLGRRDGGMRPRIAAAVQAVLMYATIVVVLVLLTPAGVMGGGALPKLVFLVRTLVLLALATAFLWMRGATWADVGLRRPRLLRLLAAVPLGYIACLSAGLAVRALQGTLNPHTGAGKDYAMFQPVAHHLPEYLFWVFASWTTVAFGEEMLFRGFMLDALQRALGGRTWALVVAVLAQGVLFGALHIYQGVNGAVVAGALGVVLGFVWWGSGRNLWAGIVVHGLIDSVSMTVIYLGLLPH